MTDKSKLRLPSMSGVKNHEMSEQEITQIKSEILAKATQQARACDWCGDADWFLEPSPQTSVAFDILRDVHVHNRVSLELQLVCKNCGNAKQFKAEQYNLSTRHGVGKRGE